MDQISLFQEEKLKINKPIRLIEMFAGIGAQAKALERLGVPFSLHRAVEIDKYAVKSYNEVHKDYLTEEVVPTDITKVHAADLDITDTDKYIYILTYSFPCQDISNAGLQKGFVKGSGTRSGLLWEVERILREIDLFDDELPQILLMENVPQVHGKKNLSSFNEWLTFLESIGYANHWADLNAKDHGVPQNRNRTFCVSILRSAGIGTEYEFPQPYELELRLKDVLEDEVDEKYYLSDTAVKGLLDQLENFPIPPQ